MITRTEATAQILAAKNSESTPCVMKALPHKDYEVFPSHLQEAKHASNGIK